MAQVALDGRGDLEHLCVNGSLEASDWNNHRHDDRISTDDELRAEEVLIQNNEPVLPFEDSHLIAGRQRIVSYLHPYFSYFCGLFEAKVLGGPC